MIYNIDFDITACILSLFMLYYILVKKGLQTLANRFFLALVLINLATAIIDIYASSLDSHLDINVFWKADIINSLYLGVHNTLPPLLFFYTLCLTGSYRRMSRGLKAAACIPLAVDYLLFMLNPFLHNVYYYDENNIYQHAPLFFLVYGIAFGYMCASAILVIVQRRNVTKAKRYSLIFIIAATIAAIIVQIFYPFLLLEIFAQTLGFLGILLSIENQDDILNQITKVYNLYTFLETAPGYLGRGDNTVIVIRLQELSYYNTTIGILRMNTCLRQIASFLSRVDWRLSCYDLGDGRFVLLGSGLSESERETFTEQISDRFKKPWSHKGHGVQIPALICAAGTDSLSSMEELLLIVDALFGGNDTAIVTLGEITQKHKRLILVEQLIRDAITEKLFQVYYQPIWDRENGGFHSAEALIRLQTEEYGFISPEEFIPIAEGNGQIVEIGQFVFDEVCRFYKTNQLEKLGIEYIEVNLSTVQCMDPELVQSFNETLRRYRLPSERINLEITETATVDNQRALKDNINLLSGLGFSFSLDDYGTGYSNFSYMFDLPFSIIKLDKSILWRALPPDGDDGSKNSMLLLSNTIRMMKDMGYRVLVEGIETNEQKQLLEELSCDYFQGYYFSKPIPGDIFLDFIRKAS